jgi:hypothetical protein
MPPMGFKPTISTGEQPQTYALDRTSTGIGKTKPYRPETYWGSKTYMKLNLKNPLMI